MKFSQTHHDGNSIEYNVPEEADLNEVLDSFVDFLRGCGYTIPYESYLTIVSDHEEEFPQKRESYWDYMGRRMKEEDDRVEHWGQDVDFD
jgi:hypothetical protein